MRVISIYTSFANQGGAQDMALQLATRLNSDKPTILSCDRIDRVHTSYRDRGVFLPFDYRVITSLATADTIFLSHHRKMTTWLMLYRVFARKDIKVVHIAHNTFCNLRWACLFPGKNIAVSSEVKQNLLGYFRLREESVSLVYNGLPDLSKGRVGPRNADGRIKVLLLGRICSVKRQLDIVRNTLGKLGPHVQLSFAGVGTDSEELKTLIAGNVQYDYLGQIDIHSTLPDYDYVLLFSEKEGLPLSLIEACMYGKPMITNTLEAVQEVNKHNLTGYVCQNYDELVLTLNSLPLNWSPEYQKLSLNARERYLTLFREDEMIRRYSEILLEVLSSTNK